MTPHWFEYGEPDPVERLYADRDHQAQGDHYLRHVNAMTAEGLHAKSAIAGELAHRDIEIERLRAIIKAGVDNTSAGVALRLLRAERDALRGFSTTAEATLAAIDKHCVNTLRTNSKDRGDWAEDVAFIGKLARGH